MSVLIGSEWVHAKQGSFVLLPGGTIHDFENRSNAPAAVLKVLHRLERQGHVEGTWGTSDTGRKRKYYRITEPGRAQLAQQRQQWQAVDAALCNIWRDVSLTFSPVPSHA